MPTSYTRTGDINTLLGDEHRARSVSVFVRPHLTGDEPLIDQTGKKILAGPSRVPVAADGTFTVTLPGTDSTDLNVLPGEWWYELTVVYPNALAGQQHARNPETTWTVYFQLTASGDFADAGFLDDAAPLSVASASAYAAQAKAIAGADTADDLITILDADPDSTFRQQQDARLSATIAAEVAPTASLQEQERRAAFIVDSLAAPGGTASAALVRYADGYKMMRHLGAQRWEQIDLRRYAGFAPTWTPTVHQLHHRRITMPVLSHPVTHSTVTRSGTGWRGPGMELPNADAHGGVYDRTSIAGDYIEITVSGASRVGLHYCTAQLGGYGVVTIDGDPTRADLLPTAQNEVDGGRLAASALTTGGGTLNPTDRLMEYYTSGATAYGVSRLVSSTMTGTETVVRVTATGYARTGATGAQIFSTGWGYGSKAVTHETAGIDWMTETNILSTFIHGAAPVAANNSAYEPVYRFTPTGGSQAVFLGNVHGYETETGLALAVDGAPVTLAVGEMLTGSSVEVTRASTLHHPEVGGGATVVATVSNSYRITARGLDLAHRVQWATAGAVNASYLMLPVNGARFTHAGMTIGADLNPTASAGGTVGHRKAGTVYLWSPGGPYATAIHTPDVAEAVADWAYTGPQMTYVEDRTKASGDMHKVYITRASAGTPEPVTVGKIMRARVLYATQRLADAALVLARA